MESELTLQLSQPESIPCFVSWEEDDSNRTFICPSNNEAHRIFIEDKNKEHLSVMSDGRLVGFIMLDGLQNEDSAVELKRIVINEKGKGYGRKAMQLVKQRVKEKFAAKHLWLDVFEDNERARSLYRSEGFIEKKLKREESVETCCGSRELIVMSIELN